MYINCSNNNSDSSSNSSSGSIVYVVQSPDHKRNSVYNYFPYYKSTYTSIYSHTHLILPLFQYYISTVYHLSDYQLLYTPIIYYLLHKSLPNCLITCLTRYYSLSLSFFVLSLFLSFAISSPILPSCKYVYLSSTVTVSRCVSVNNFA